MKQIYFLWVCVFCLLVCTYTMCVQCPWNQKTAMCPLEPPNVGAGNLRT